MNPALLANAVLIGQRLAVVKVSPHFLVQALTQHPGPAPVALIVQAGLPPDTQLVRVEGQPDGTIVLVCTHPAFPLPRADGMLQEVRVQIQAVHLGAPQQPPPDEPAPLSMNRAERRRMAKGQ